MREQGKPKLVIAPHPAEPTDATTAVGGPDEEATYVTAQQPDEPVVLRRASAPGGGEYQARPDGIFFVRDELEVHIANFDVRLVRRARRSDRTDLVLAVRIGEFERDLTLSSAKFESLRWITDFVPGGVLAPVPAARSRLLAAIALLSSPREVQVVEQLGWRCDERGRWTYAHANGGIGEHGHVALDVQVGAPLDRFVLPAPGDVAANTLLSLLGLAPDRIVVPLLASVVRAVFGDVRFAVHVWGTTGAGKSQLAAIAQSFWGRGMSTGSELPASWSSTANSNELITHTAKDALVVVDDWLPQSVPEEQVDRLVRAAGNAGGRARMGMPARPPRALIFSTGEAVPQHVASLIARMLTIRVEVGDMDWARLTVAQQAARDGSHAAWLARFIKWCAPQLVELRDRLDQFVVQGRSRWSSFDVHARTVDALAELAGAWRVLASYLWDAGGLQLTEVEAFVRRGEAALEEIAREQERAQLAGQPVALFLSILQELVERGRVRIARSVHDDELGEIPLVGWLRDREVLLIPAVALSVVQDHLRERGGALDLSEQQLGKILREAGFLLRIDGRGAKIRYSARATVGGARRPVWALNAEALGLGGGGPRGPR